MLSPHAEKWGDASTRPPPIDARDVDRRVRRQTNTGTDHHLPTGIDQHCDRPPREATAEKNTL